MTNRAFSPRTPRAGTRLSKYHRDMIACFALSGGIFFSACMLAAAWAATHPVIGV